jgi:hypothetical protein
MQNELISGSVIERVEVSSKAESPDAEFEQARRRRRRDGRGGREGRAKG